MSECTVASAPSRDSGTKPYPIENGAPAAKRVGAADPGKMFSRAPDLGALEGPSGATTTNAAMWCLLVEGRARSIRVHAQGALNDPPCPGWTTRERPCEAFALGSEQGAQRGRCAARDKASLCPPGGDEPGSGGTGRGPKPRALLAALALDAGRVVSVDRSLIESALAGEPPDTAAHAVQVYVSQLRKALGEEAISTRAARRTCSSWTRERVDVHRFVAARERGPRRRSHAGDAAAAERRAAGGARALAGPRARRLHVRALRADRDRPARGAPCSSRVEERIEADLALGRHAELVSELEALVQSQPLRERPRAQLMLALYRSGRQADALAGVPGGARDPRRGARDRARPAAQELEAAILRQDESLLLDETAPAKPAMQFRRLVTILFVDVVESMALAEALDAEALGRVLQRYFETVSAALDPPRRNGREVRRATRSWPRSAIPVSHEDDALRAARAAFDIQAGGRRAAATQLEQRARHRARGAESGSQRARSSRRRRTRGSVSSRATPSVSPPGSSRRRAPGEIVVGEVVARLIDHAARLEPLGEARRSGAGRAPDPRCSGSLELRAGQRRPSSDRLDAPLVGRKRELAALRRSLKRAVDDVHGPGRGRRRPAGCRKVAARRRAHAPREGRHGALGPLPVLRRRHHVLAAPRGARSRRRRARSATRSRPRSRPTRRRRRPRSRWRFRQFCEALAT